jgi:ankyrin repeat protein
LIIPTFAELAASKDPLSEQFLNAAKKGDLETINILLEGKPDLLRVEDNDNHNAWWFAYAGHHLDVADGLLDLGLRAPDSYYTLCQLREKFYHVDYCTDDADVLSRILEQCLLNNISDIRISAIVSLLQRCKDYKLAHLGDELMRFYLGCNASKLFLEQLCWYQLRIITSVSTVAKSKSLLNLARGRELINLKDAHGLTLLDYAIRESNLSNVALFLEMGADIDSLIGYRRLKAFQSMGKNNA